MEAGARELTRTRDALASAPEPPYWLALGFVDRHAVEIQATNGAASNIGTSHHRFGDVDVRVGTPELDNTHKIRDAGWFSEVPRPQMALPLEDTVPRATELGIWQATDESYRAATRRLIKVRTNEAVKVAREDQSADFSMADPVIDIGPVTPITVDRAAWTDAVRVASAVFMEYPEVIDSNVTFRLHDDVHMMLNSEGTRIRVQRPRVRVSLWCSTIADDGMALQVYDYIDAAHPDRLPDAAALVQMAHDAANKLVALRQAPLIEPYVGPAILRGRAAAVFFHEILGHRVEGHRQKDEDEGQTLAEKVGEQIFPEFIDVVDDPTLERWDDVDLNGYYRYDDEGVPAQRVLVVDDGVLRSFLMSRAPIEGFSTSNGHGRRQPGSAVVARQGNLQVESSQTVSWEALRTELIAEVQREGKPFGLIFDDISGGFTFTGRTTPNSYAVSPVTVWRVYPDERPDELVRGVDLIGTPLTTFSRIMGASDTTQVFNGVCGAESGWVPVSAISPDLLISEVEVQRREKENDRPPLLPAPRANAGEEE